MQTLRNSVATHENDSGSEVDWQPMHARARYNVLVIDDDPDQLALFSHLLADAGYQVQRANSALEGLQALRQSKIDCIVCDVYMPWLDGRVFTHRVRASRKFSDIPIVMLTAGSENLEMALLACGADLFCLKREASKLLISQVDLLLS